MGADPLKVDSSIPEHRREVAYTHAMDPVYPDRAISFESNNSLWFSETQLFGRLNDYLGEDLNLDKSALGRSALFIMAAYTNWVTTYASHEVAHGQIFRNFGKHPGLSVDFTDWSAAFPSISGTSSGFDRTEDFIEGSVAWMNVHGLVQQKINAMSQYRHNTTSSVMSYDEGLSYLFNGLSDVAYIAAEYLDSTKFNYGSYGNGDITAQLGTLDIHGISFSKEHWLVGSLACTLSSFHFYESILAVTKGYLVSGERTSRPFAFEVGDKKIVPPNFEAIPHPKGLFANGELPVNNLFGSGEWVFFNLGAGLNKDVKKMRFGAELKGLDIFKSGKWFIPTMDLNASATIDVGKAANSGGAVGGGLNWKIGDSFAVSASVLYSRNDVMQNEIMGKGRGKKTIYYSQSADGKYVSKTPTDAVEPLPQSLEFFLTLKLDL